MMHLYFQSAHEEHQMGLGQTLIQFLKNVICITSLCCKVVRPSQARGTYLLAPQKDLLKDLLGVGYSHQLAIVMNNTTSHHNSRSLINMCIDAM